jgi:hypothetical protein
MLVLLAAPAIQMIQQIGEFLVLLLDISLIGGCHGFSGPNSLQPRP